MARWTKVVGNKIQTGIYFDEPSNACWFATVDGTIQTFRILGQTLRALGTGWTDAISVLPSIDGLNVFVVLSTGELLVVSRAAAHRGQARVLLSVDAAVLGASRLANDDLLILDDSGQVYHVSPASGTSEVLITVPGATGLATDEAAGELLIAVSSATSQIGRFKLDDGSVVGAPFDIDSPVAALAPAPSGSGVLVCDDAGNLFSQDWPGTIDPFTFTSAGATSVCRWHSLVIVASGSTLELVEWGKDVETLQVTAGLDPLVIGGWVPMIVDYAAAGLTQDGVEWQVDEGPGAAALSVALPVRATGDAYEHRVIGGVGTPEFHLTARDRSTSQVVATRRFRVVRIWPDTEVGPPMARTGAQRVYAKGGWGGGPAGPQNINVHPAPEELRIAVGVFRTKGSTSNVNVNQRLSDLTENVKGAGESVKRYYEEVSYRATPPSANPAYPKGTTVTLLGGQVFGPIDVDYTWGHLFEPPAPNDTWGPWIPKGDTWNLLGAELSAFLLDRGLEISVTSIADSFVLTVLPGTDDPYTVGDKTWAAQWSWAFAGDTQVYWKGPSWTTVTTRAAVVMPAALPANHPAPWSSHDFMTTICHELGHNLGCPDLYSGGDYPAEIAGRYMEGWDLMDSDAPLPHYSLPHRMRLGWISPDWIEVLRLRCESSQQNGHPAGD